MHCCALENVWDHLLIQIFLAADQAVKERQIAPKKTVTNCQITEESVGRGQDQSPRLHISRPGNCPGIYIGHRRVACVKWSAVMLPPHIMLSILWMRKSLWTRL